MSPLHIFFFFFNDTATTEIYTLSLHDALPISFRSSSSTRWPSTEEASITSSGIRTPSPTFLRSEEHTSELQSRLHLVCRLLLEKKKIKKSHQLRSREYHVHFSCYYVLYHAVER